MKITKELLIKSPLYIDLPRVRTKYKRVYLNMNSYGNTNTFTNNEVKKAYLEMIREQLEGVVLETPIEVCYRVYKPSKRRLDKMNVVSVVSKYLMDALTTIGCIEDDNDDIIQSETIRPTQYSRGDGYVLVHIKSLSISV